MKESGWIKVTDRLPEEHTRVLTYGSLLFSHIIEIAIFSMDYGIERAPHFDTDYSSNVTHWRPLPDEPKEDE